MHFLLFIFYGILACYAITKISFFRDSGIRPLFLLLYFGLRVATGCLHNLIAYRYYPNHGDIWQFFEESFITRHELFTDLHLFWANNSTLAYLPHNLIECGHLLLNFLSFDNLYINTLFFAFFTLGGSIAFFRVFVSWFGRDWLSSSCILLLPSTLFWTSCIHTEGILFILLGFYFFHLNKLFPPGQSTTFDRDLQPVHSSRSILWVLLLFFLVVFFRPAVLPGLLPATLCWIFGRAVRFHPRRRFIRLLGAAALVVGLAGIALFTSVFDFLLSYLSHRQEEFQLLTGNSRIYLPVLEANWHSLISLFPIAVVNGFFQPLPGSGGQAIYSVFALELMVIWVIILLSVSRRLTRGGIGKTPPSGGIFFRLSWLFFSVLGMLLIGYIIPFVGSIIRYRSLYLPFLLAPFLHDLRGSRVVAFVNRQLTRFFRE